MKRKNPENPESFLVKNPEIPEKRTFTPTKSLKTPKTVRFITEKIASSFCSIKNPMRIDNKWKLLCVAKGV
jgi:hypothetical protein